MPASVTVINQNFLGPSIIDGRFLKNINRKKEDAYLLKRERRRFWFKDKARFVFV